jgi:hypothetical protein
VKNVQAALAIILLLQAGLMLVAAIYAPGPRLYLVLISCTAGTALVLWHVSHIGKQ